MDKHVKHPALGSASCLLPIYGGYWAADKISSEDRAGQVGVRGACLSPPPSNGGASISLARYRQCAVCLLEKPPSIRSWGWTLRRWKLPLSPKATIFKRPFRRHWEPMWEAMPVSAKYHRYSCPEVTCRPCVGCVGLNMKNQEYSVPPKLGIRPQAFCRHLHLVDVKWRRTYSTTTTTTTEHPSFAQVFLYFGKHFFKCVF